MRSFAIGLVFAVGCAGDEPASTPMCTRSLYEPCVEEHDCMSGFCQNFTDQAFQVCSQPCDAQTPCPDGATCDDALGFCRPAAPKTCTL